MLASFLRHPAFLPWLLGCVAVFAQTTDAGTPPRERTVRQRAAAAAPPPPATPASEPMPFFDAHVHLNDEAMQLALMQTHGVPRAVVFWGRHSDNARVADAARRHPERFVAFASVSPERNAYRSAWSGDPAPMLRELDELLASGRFRGIGEISAVHFPSPGLAEADFDPSGAALAGILELARRYKVPVMVHVEITRLRELGLLLERFRDVTVIWAHGGYTPLFLARRMLEQHPNLVYELSARTWPRHPRSPEYTLLADGQQVWPQWLALIESMPTRFIVGTDASHHSEASERMKIDSVQGLLRQLSPATRTRVASANLQAILGDKP